MAPLQVHDPSTPPSMSPSSSDSSDDNATHESSESSDDNAAPVVSRKRCMNPGRRRIGGRIYDSILGVTCHWCRQKTVEDHVFCCHCKIAFCGGCLRNRHGEDIEIEMKDDNEWTCPKCRGGCGPGCRNCCNCGPCRKAQGFEPTGLLVHAARARGFTNVHDYLIHQKTGESEETIAKRKEGKEWCQTNPSTFQRKQKRNEEEIGVEASCRKRLNFALTDSIQEKMGDKLLQSNASPVSIMSKDDKLSQVASLRHKDGGMLTERSTHVSRPPSESVAVAHPQPVSDVQAEMESCGKAAIFPLGKDTFIVEPLFQCKVVQPKPDLDKHVLEDPRSGAAMPSLGKVTDVLYQSQSEVSSSPYSQQHPSTQTDALSQLETEEVSITHESGTKHIGLVKEEPFEPDSSSKLCVPGNTLGTLKIVKTEVEPLCNQTDQLTKATHLWQAKRESLDKPVQVTEGLNTQLIRVKEELQDEWLQPTRGNVSNTRLNVFNAAFTRGDCDAAWGRFEVPSQNVEGSTCSMGDAKSAVSPSISNFHLCPVNLMPVFSHVKEGVMNGQHDMAVKIERFGTQEAQCNTAPRHVTNKSSKDQSTDGVQSSISFPDPEWKASVATVKKEPEECWNWPAPVQSTMDASHLVGNVKVKLGRQNSSFTIEPSPCPGLANSGGLPQNRVKEEPMYIGDIESLALSGRGRPEVPEGVKKSSSLGSVSHPWKVDDFRNKLETKLSEPFSRKELEELAAAASHRKPIYKARETRQGCYQVVSEEEGYSYLDHHPDLDFQLKESVSPVARLSLLRGFFLWLEHASTDGAFKPWIRVSRPTEMRESDDCVEIEGPDCEILAVVCPVDEKD